MSQAQISALGSSVISALIAGLMGRMFGLPTVVLITLILCSAAGGAWFGYRSQQKQ